MLVLGDLSLRRRRREAALLFPESWWHLTMWGSRPSHFMVIPNTKRHPHNTKTYQIPISEVIIGLPRPYHNIIKNAIRTAGWYLQENKNFSVVILKKFGGGYTEVSVECTHSGIRNSSWTPTVIRQRSRRKAGWDWQENKTFVSRYTEVSVERMNLFPK